MRRLLAVGLLAGLGLVACGGDPWVGEGTVVARSYDDADVVWVPGHTAFDRLHDIAETNRKFDAGLKWWRSEA
jgi:hypothetical protein